MKNIVLSAVAVLAMSSFATAGGDIAPVEEPVVLAPVVDDSGFYLGLAYSSLNMTNDSLDTIDPAWDQGYDKTWSEIMIQAGYKFNEYVAVEGRYWFGLEDTTQIPNVYQVVGAIDSSVDAWGLYVKPMYPVTEDFDIYALLGYASSDFSADDITVDTFDGFSWGLGGSYTFTENFSVFVDYVRLYDDTDSYTNNLDGRIVDVDTAIDTWNFGVAYKF